MPKGQRRQLLSLVEREPAGADRREHTVVAERIHDHRNTGMVLRGGSHHRRAADVDLLDAFIDIGSRIHRLGEWIQVDDHQFERRDAEVLQRGDVLHLALIGKQACVHVRVQCLDPPVEHLGEAGDLFHRDDGNALVCNGFRG